MGLGKNDLAVVDIIDLSTDGSGIGKVDGFTLFVKDAVIGDKVRVKVVKAKKNYGYARLMEVLEPSADRVEARCGFARQCGGCQLQELSYEKQLAFKEDKIRNNLQRIGGFEEIPMEPMVGMEVPFEYRNKAQFPVGVNRDGKIITGFYAGRTHSIIENRDCCLGVSQNKEVLDRVIGFMERYGISAYDEETGKGLVRHVLLRYGFKTREIMVCLIVNGTKLPHAGELVDSLREMDGMTSICLNVNTKRNNVILGEEVQVLWGQGYITDYIGDISFRISPLSFYQVNPVQTEKLYNLAMEYAGLTGEETVWDMYCGIGTISLFLAQKAKNVYGVEIVPQAIADAKENAARNGFENAHFYVGKAEEVLPEKFEQEKIKADVIVVDPPRKGCEESLLATMAEMAPEKIVYVSCDSATLARDLKYLCAHGYELKRVRGVDQFGMTVHVETVVLMSRVQK